MEKNSNDNPDSSSSSKQSTTTSPRARPPNLTNFPSRQSSAASSSSSVSASPHLSPRHEYPPTHSHRSSFTDNLRYPPPSPRAQRQPSFSGTALTELLLSKPASTSNPAGTMTGSRPQSTAFIGRDWRSVQVHEIVDPAGARFVELDTSIEETTKLLVRSGAPNVVLVRESHRTKTAMGWFGYDDLNAYLLLVLGMTAAPDDEEGRRIAELARKGEVLWLKDVRAHLGSTEEPVVLPHTAGLAQAVEVLGSGVHRAVVVKEGTTEAVGVLSQLRLVQFFWENHQNFVPTEALYARSLQELQLGAKVVVSINGDRPLSDALRMMHDEGITSLPVLDSHSNVVGNISHVDVRLLTDTSSIPLLSSSCIHFVSVILSERGVEDGKDAYPVFYVTRTSTLAHVVAKLCATRSHRMWIVESPSPAPSIPPSPSVASVTPAIPPSAMQQNHQHQSGAAVPPSPGKLPATANGQHLSPSPSPAAAGASPAPTTGTPSTRPARSGSHPSSTSEATPGPPFTSLGPGISVSAAQLPGSGISGRLSGVVSLTDVLNLFAKASGLKPIDPEEVRLARRRRRSSSSASGRPRLEGLGGAAAAAAAAAAQQQHQQPQGRVSGEALRVSGEMARSGSLKRR